MFACVLGSLVFGVYIGGLAIASLHRYAHMVKLRDIDQVGPRAAAVYVKFHLAHHRYTEPFTCPESKSQSLSTWVMQVRWAVGFALRGDRWVALRTLFLYRAAQFSLIIGLLSQKIWLSLTMLIVLAISQFLVLVAYDLCHLWTHEGGPMPSSIHAAHHAEPRRDFGMWRWHNWVGDTIVCWNIRSITLAERALSCIPGQREKLKKMYYKATLALGR